MDIKKLKKLRSDFLETKFIFKYIPYKYHERYKELLEILAKDLNDQVENQKVIVENNNFFKYPCKIKEIKKIKKAECLMCYHIQYLNYLIDEFNNLIKEYCLIFGIK